jgi:hypothetical protein
VRGHHFHFDGLATAESAGDVNGRLVLNASSFQSDSVTLENFCAVNENLIYSRNAFLFLQRAKKDEMN